MTEGRTPALSLRGIVIRRGDRDVVRGVSLEVAAGECLCITGPNGSGKSTLLQGMLGLLPLAEGSVSLGAVPVGYVPQVEGAEREFPASAWEVVLAGTQRPGWRLPLYRAADRMAAARALEAVGALSLARHRIGDLSGGQLQRVMLARALCGRPALLLLDEPCNGIDPAGRQSFHELIAALQANEGMTVVAVSHHRGEIEALADRVAVMQEGRLAFLGPAEDWRGEVSS